MPDAFKPAQLRAVRTRALAIIADLYLFPQPDRALAGALAAQFPGVGESTVRDCFSYLEKKGFVKTVRRKDGQVTAEITAKGIDLVEGAVTDRGVLPARADFTGLTLKRGVRAGILAYCRRFPESFNGDDEILAELKELGLGGLLIEQVRYHIWYLDAKGYVEMKTHPIHGDLVFMARITAAGVDLAEGACSDPGVRADG